MSAAAQSNARNPRPEIERQHLRLEIEPVIARAETLATQVARELPTHEGLARVALGVAQIARDAKQVSKRLRRAIGWHRLPAAFLIVSLVLLCGLLYWQFLHTSKLVVAIPERDAVQLTGMLRGSSRLRLKETSTVGSRASLQLMQQGGADLAYVQGGVEIPHELISTELEQTELVLLFLRDSISHPTQMRKILTSHIDQGSHSLARIFASYWQIDDKVEFIHDWRKFTDDVTCQIAADVDAVFVVKDPLSEKLEGTAARLAAAGFRLVAPDIGAMSLRLKYLRPFEILPGYLDPAEQLPKESVSTYSVVTYLVARPTLTAHQLAEAQRLLHPDHAFPSPLVEPSLNLASEVAQGLEAALGIMVYVGLAFLALLGLDAVAYRRRFHELNSMVSLISMHQSSKDVISGSRAHKAHNVTYLSVCSDLLGLIAAITGYYTQENSSLLYNRLSDIIHERCDGLKINIQLKILQALIDMPPLDKANESLSSLASPPKALKERTESSASAESLAASGEDAPTESNSS